ncbi:hypothetical protein D3C72_2175070 [compost metagenome]
MAVPGAGFSKRPWRRLAVVQPPMTGSAPAVRQAVGTSISMAVTFFLARSSLAADSAFAANSVAGALMLIKSNVSPKFTTNGSLRWPTNRRAGVAQPGMLTAYTCCAAYAA